MSALRCRLNFKRRTEMNKIKMLACVLTMGMLFDAFASENVWTLDNSAPMPGKFWTITSPDKKWKLACAPTDRMDVHLDSECNADLAICSQYWCDDGERVATEDIYKKEIDAVISGSGVLTLPVVARDARGNEYSIELADWSMEGWYKFGGSQVTKLIITADYYGYFGEGTSLAEFEVEAGNAKYYSVDGAIYLKSEYRDDYAEGDVLLQCPTKKSIKFAIPESVTKVRSGALERVSYTELVIGPKLEIFESDSETMDKLKAITIVDNDRFKYVGGLLLGDGGKTVVMNLGGVLSAQADINVPASVDKVDPYAMAYIDGKAIKNVVFTSSELRLEDGALYNCIMPNACIDLGAVGSLSMHRYALGETTASSVILPESVVFEDEWGWGYLDLEETEIKDIYWPTEKSWADSGLYEIWTEGKNVRLHILKDAGDWSGFYSEGVTVVKDMVRSSRITAVSSDEAGGTVVGGGRFSVGQSCFLEAKANKGYVFAGWYDTDGNPASGNVDYHLAQFSCAVNEYNQTLVARFVPVVANVNVKATTEKGQVFAGWYTDSQLQSPYVASDGTDYRTASCTYSIPLYSSLFPRVVSEVEDRNIDLECVPQEFYDSNKQMSLPVRAISYSLPTITAANLPTGLKFDAKTMLVSGTPTKPGEAKIVKFTVKNLTNKTGAIFERLIKIGDARAESLPDLKYNDADGYPAFVPGAEQDMAEVLGQSTMDVLAQGGWMVTGLPAGMKFDPKTGKFSGAPTKGNEAYLVTFKKGNETATITLRTGALPVLELEPLVIVDELDESVAIPDMSKFKLTGAGSYIAGKDVTLGATAPAGWVFAGWEEVDSMHLGIGMCPDFADMTLDARTNDTRIAAYKFKMPATERMRLRGIFIHQSQDELLSMMAAPGMTMQYILNSGEDIVKSMNYMAVTVVRDCFRPSQMVSSFPTVTVKGLPAGLKLDAKTLLLSGKVTAKPGHYYATFTAKNLSGYTLTVPVKFIVSDMHQPPSPEDPSDVNTMPPWFFANEFMRLENLAAGAPIGYEDPNENWGYVISGTEIEFGHPGCPEGGLISFSGLPKGLTAKGDWTYTDSIGKFTAWYIEGIPTEAGWYTVSATGKGYDGFEIENYKYSKHIAVAETPSKYVFVKVAQGEGTVTGSGVWNAGKSYSINATPKAGYVFAGWYQDEMCVVPAQNWTFGNECDYRKASQKWTLEAEFLRMIPGPGALYAKFVPKAEDDGDVEVIAIGSYSESGWDSADIYNEYWSNLSDDFIWYINPTEDGYAGDELGLLINSVTEPTVTVKGLPKEFEFEGTYADGLYVIECDGSPAPGEYIAELTVKTATLKNPVTFKFAVRVPHYRHWELPLDYDNGYTLIPGATFDHDMLMPGVNLVGWTVTGLPAGMTFDAKTGRIRGASTAADKSYTVWFKRGDETASVTMRTSALPKLEVVASLYDGVYNASLEGVKLSGAGSYAANASVTLTATAPKGWVFAGWYGGEYGEFSLENGAQDYRTASGYKFVMPEEIPSDGVVRVVAKFAPINFDFARVYDEDSSYISVVAGEPLPSDFIKYAVESLSLPTVTVKGLPTGVSFNAKTFELTGKATDETPKWYDLIVSVKNVSGYMYTGIFGISVNGGMPKEDIDELGISWQLHWLEQLRVGDRVPEESCFGSVADGVTGVTGLPKELTVFKEAEDYDEPVFLLAEVENDMPFIKTPGVYTVVVNGNRDGKALKTTKRIVIRDSESVYVRVAAADGCESMGSVSGDGAVVHPGETFQINATPKAGYVFAGWYYDSFCMYDKALNPYRDWEYDYRTAQQKWMAGYAIYGDYWTYSTPINLHAKFMPLQEADQNITVLAGYYWDSPYGLPELESGNSFTVMSDWGGWYMNLQFMSDTLPEVTVTGLPAGIYIDTPLWSDGEAELYCEDVGAVKPGVYDVTLKVKNKNITREYNFSLVVPLQRTSAIFDGILDVTEEGMLFNVGVTPDLNFWNLGPDVAVSATGLPTGMTLQKDSSGLYALSGAPTQVGNYTVTFTATCDGRKETQMVFFRVQALPDWAVGTFNGDGDFINSKDPDGDWMGGVSTLTVSKTGALSGKVIYSINGKQVTATMQATAFSKNVQLDYETMLRLTDIDEYDGESPAMPYSGATAYVYEDVAVSVPGYGTFPVDVYLYQVSYGNDGESVGIIRTIQRHNKLGLEGDVFVQFEGVQNLWERKSEVIDLPVFDDNLSNWAHGKKSHWFGDYEFTFGDSGKLTVVYHNPYGAKQTASAQILVDGIDYSGTYLAWTVVSFPQIDEMVWFAIDLTLDERGLVSTYGIDIWED